MAATDTPLTVRHALPAAHWSPAPAPAFSGTFGAEGACSRPVYPRPADHEAMLRRRRSPHVLRPPRLPPTAGRPFYQRHRRDELTSDRALFARVHSFDSSSPARHRRDPTGTTDRPGTRPPSRRAVPAPRCWLRRQSRSVTTWTIGRRVPRRAAQKAGVGCIRLTHRLPRGAGNSAPRGLPGIRGRGWRSLAPALRRRDLADSALKERNSSFHVQAAAAHGGSLHEVGCRGGDFLDILRAPHRTAVLLHLLLLTSPAGPLRRRCCWHRGWTVGLGQMRRNDFAGRPGTGGGRRPGRAGLGGRTAADGRLHTATAAGCGGAIPPDRLGAPARAGRRPRHDELRQRSPTA